MNEATFLSALHESPNDEVTWLALADWLEEDGQSDRAELVRLVRRLRAFPVMKRTKAKSTLEERVAALLNSGVRPVVPEMVNDLGMRFALIPPGRFRMGSPSGEKERSSDETAHEVEITQAFYLAICPVTQSQYESVMGRNPSYFSRKGAGKEKLKDISDDELANFPVENVSWEDAQAFLNVLTAQAESREKKWEYRLPSEAEWEYSCRGGPSSCTPFHTGSSLGSHQANFNGKYPYGDAENGPYLERTCAVGSYRPNAFGLHDMHGNVGEWCADWYGEYPSRPITDASVPSDGSDRVFRGGSWYDFGQGCRAAFWDGLSPSSRCSDLGFRVALVPARAGQDRAEAGTDQQRSD